jgi:hypothetical protein
MSEISLAQCSRFFIIIISFSFLLSLKSIGEYDEKKIVHSTTVMKLEACVWSE